MSKDAKPARWFAAWRTPRRVSVGDDPADVGTAFGLELSMDSVAAEPPPPVTTARGGWIRRLAARRRSAS